MWLKWKISEAGHEIKKTVINARIQVCKGKCVSIGMSIVLAFSLLEYPMKVVTKVLGSRFCA